MILKEESLKMDTNKLITHSNLTTLYLDLKKEVVNEGYNDEIEWQNTRDLESISESEFLQESAWVILNTGMREKVIRGLFDDISEAFMNWKSADMIVQNDKSCMDSACAVFNNTRKVEAIISLCRRVSDLGISNIISSIKTDGVEYLKSFKFIGPITCYHLAKNIGLDVVKPDRHLVRIAHATKINDPLKLCLKISKATGDKISVVDLVLWRYATLNDNYVKLFKQYSM